MVQLFGIKNLIEKQRLNICTDNDDNAVIIRLYIVIDLIESV